MFEIKDIEAVRKRTIQNTIYKYIPGMENKKIKLFTGQFIKEISDFRTIYCDFSGGYHSTTSALQLDDSGFENVVLIHNKTYLETKYCLDLIQKVIYMTDYPYILIDPKEYGLKERIGDIFRDSLKKVPEIIKKFQCNESLNIRDIIPCCRKLKKAPSRRFYTKEIDKSNSVIISSILPHENQNRRRRLKELREKGTYLRLVKKKGNVWYAYPWRDMHSDRPFHDYLWTKGIMPEHSGCVMCPIQIAYKKWKEG